METELIEAAAELTAKDEMLAFTLGALRVALGAHAESKRSAMAESLRQSAVRFRGGRLTLAPEISGLTLDQVSAMNRIYRQETQRLTDRFAESLAEPF